MSDEMVPYLCMNEVQMLRALMVITFDLRSDFRVRYYPLGQWQVSVPKGVSLTFEDRVFKGEAR